MSVLKNYAVHMKGLTFGLAAGAVLSGLALSGCEKAAIVANEPVAEAPAVAEAVEAPALAPKDQAAAQLRGTHSGAATSGQTPRQAYEASRKARAARIAAEAKNRENVPVPQPVRPEYEGRLVPGMKPPQ